MVKFSYTILYVKDVSKAIDFYEKALINTMNNDKVKDYQTDIERCRIKLNVGRYSKVWVSFRRKKTLV